ncbi:hypothetical protein A9174_33715 (plasmid) [Mesorhizobium loti NZP2037]|nr:hypothetical protein A9174_33715 [Mesorhizobium loti NZP2037]
MARCWYKAYAAGPVAPPLVRSLSALEAVARAKPIRAGSWRHRLVQLRNRQHARSQPLGSPLRRLSRLIHHGLEGIEQHVGVLLREDERWPNLRTFLGASAGIDKNATIAKAIDDTCRFNRIWIPIYPDDFHADHQAGPSHFAQLTMMCSEVGQAALDI